MDPRGQEPRELCVGGNKLPGPRPLWSPGCVLQVVGSPGMDIKIPREAMCRRFGP